MKRTIWIGILLLCIGIGKARAQNDPVLAGMILLYTDKAEKELKKQEKVMLMQTTGHLWTKGLEETKLTVLQGMNNEAVDVSSIRAMVMEDFYKNSEQRLQEQQKKITRLEENLAQYKEYDTMGRTLVPELKVLYPSITSLSIAHSLETRVDSMKTDTVTLAVLKFGKHPSVAEKEKISAWLKARVGAKKLRLITE